MLSSSLSISVKKSLEYHEMQVHEIVCLSYAFDHNIQRLFSCSSDGSIVVYNLKTDVIEQLIETDVKIFHLKVTAPCNNLQEFENEKFIELVFSDDYGSVYIFKYHYGRSKCFEYSHKLNILRGRGTRIADIFVDDQRKKLICVGRENGEIWLCKLYNEPLNVNALLRYKHRVTNYKSIDFKYGRFSGRGEFSSNIVELKTREDNYLVGGKCPNMIVRIRIRLNDEKKEEKCNFSEDLVKNDVIVCSICSFISEIDGKEKVLGSCFSELVCYWDIEGKFLMEISDKLENVVSSFYQISNDLILMGDFEGIIYVLSNYSIRDKVETPHKSYIYSFCPISQKQECLKNLKFVTCSFDSTINIYEVNGIGIKKYVDEFDFKERTEFLLEVSIDEWKNFLIITNFRNVDIPKFFLML